MVKRELTHKSHGTSAVFFFFFLLTSDSNDSVNCGLLGNFIGQFEFIQIEIVKTFLHVCSGNIALHDDW